MDMLQMKSSITIAVGIDPIRSRFVHNGFLLLVAYPLVV